MIMSNGKQNNKYEVTWSSDSLSATNAAH